MREEKRLYCCYSVPQKNFLTSKGIKYEIVALNEKTKCTMWVYIKTKELDKYLKEWSLGSNS